MRNLANRAVVALFLCLLGLPLGEKYGDDSRGRDCSFCNDKGGVKNWVNPKESFFLLKFVWQDKRKVE